MTARRVQYAVLASLTGGLCLIALLPPVPPWSSGRDAPALTAPALTAVARTVGDAAAVPGGRPAPDAETGRAAALLAAAARAAHQRSWSGTQYVVSAQPGAARLAVLEVRHAPATGLQVTAAPARGEAVAQDVVQDVADAATEVQAEVMDERLLGVLAATYRLRVARAARYLGRPIDVVEAWRPGAATPAGRFWLDRASALMLRREVYDPRGAVLRSAAYTSFDLTPGSGPVRSGPPPPALSSAGLASLAASVGMADGSWTVPQTLPGDLQLFEAAVTAPTGVRVLHLAYSDGLFRLSLFAQPGRLGAKPLTGFVHRSLAGADSWVLPASPERVVWSGGGTVWTLLSDAPAEVIGQVVGALPRDLPQDRGPWARLGRGVSRVGSWLNPFA